LKLVSVRQIEQYILCVSLENSRIISLGAGDLAGFASVEMTLSGFPAHEFFLGGDFDTLGCGFSGL